MSHFPVKVRDLQSVKPFARLNEIQLELLANRMIRRTYAPGQFIFFEGEESIGLWFILAGKVKIIKQSESGRWQGLCLVDRGKCFGNCPLFDAETNPADAQALDNVTLAVLPRNVLQELIYHDAVIAACLLDVYNMRMNLLARLGESLGTWPVGMRINDCLIAHARHDTPHPIVELTHEQLATLVGTVREMVTRHLSELELVDIIRTAPGAITILDIDALKTSCIADITNTR
jgi:CRP/FNR family transcriptional regulator